MRALRSNESQAWREQGTVGELLVGVARSSSAPTIDEDLCGALGGAQVGVPDVIPGLDDNFDDEAVDPAAMDYDAPDEETRGLVGQAYIPGLGDAAQDLAALGRQSSE